ncbi:MAG TPA: multicopper oxidase family protein [Longimicrobiales bacterium]|nr:multicopper oxidase family protein [Longimicrobiales bacterium]
MRGIDRRDFLHRTLGSALALPTAAPLLSLAGCDTDSAAGTEGFASSVAYQRRTFDGAGPVREIEIEASEGTVEVAPGRSFKTWLYNGLYPGPEIRLTAGDVLRATVRNALPEGTTIHWHGVPVPNAMDGVPGLTQEPIATSESFVYEFPATPAGSYMYHSHVGLQIDRGLIAPLIIEEKQPHVDYDRDYTVVLDDFLPGAPEPLEGGGMMGGGMMGRRRGGMMAGQVPPYESMLVNGRLPEAPVEFAARRGERVRLRLLNPSGATTFHFAIAGHRLLVTHTDGRPVEPFAVDSLYVSMGERYDVVVEANNPGVWNVMAAVVEGDTPPARAVLRYADARGATPPLEAVPEGLSRGRVLELADLRGLGVPDRGQPDQTFDLVLSGGMMSSAWTINGQAYPDAEPLEIAEGQLVRFNMVNRSPMIHPMHLHGHFFRVADVLKETVLVPPHMGRVSFDFVADNPGRWFFHCHNIYHLEQGMAREVRYV